MAWRLSSLAALLFNDATPFPGFAATLPVAGAALVILGGCRRGAPAGAPPCFGPFRYLGLIYIRLPLALADPHPRRRDPGANNDDPARPPLDPPLPRQPQRWIEEPLRHGRIIGIRPGRNLLQAAGVSLAVVITSVAVSAIPTGVTTAATDTRATPTALERYRPSTVFWLHDRGSDANPREQILDIGRVADGVCHSEDLAECTLGASQPNAPVVALFGDSHAGSWTALLAQLATTRGWRLVHLTYGGCPSLITPVWSMRVNRVFNECDAWRDLALARLQTEQPDLIIVANAEHYYMADRDGGRVEYTNPPTAKWTRLWSAGFDRMLRRLTRLGGDVAVIGDRPVPSAAGLDPTACIAKQRSGFEACGRREAPPCHRRSMISSARSRHRTA